MPKIAIVGQAPSRRGDPNDALAGAVGRKLANLLGWSQAEYARRTTRRNLLRKWPGKAGKGDRFPMASARRAAAKLARALAGRRVILLGKNVARAFGLHVEYLRWTARPFRACVVPHPSGVNRWWNDAANKAAAKRFLRKLGAA